MRTGAGFSTEAVYIFHNMVRKLRTQHQPDYLAAIFESEGPTFRDEVFEAYKATRTETPPDLLEQIPWIRKILDAMRIPVLDYPGFEADDVIGTLARRAVQQGMDAVIISSDKDMLQLVNDHVCMINPMKDDLCYDAAETEKYMGVRPDQVADLLALKGDSVDNIPGAPGIGDKGARDLIARFGSVENAMEHAAEVERKTYRESLQNNREQILLSKRLATIHTDVPVDVELEALALREPDTEALRELYRTLEFSSLLRDLAPASEAPQQRDYQQLRSKAELDAWIETLPADAPLAVAAGEMMEQPVLGFSAKLGVARSLALDKIPQRASIAHDIKALIRHFGDSPGLHHDVMLYGFLLAADPGSADLATLSERHLERPLDADPAAQADTILSLYQRLRPQVESQHLMPRCTKPSTGR